MNSHFSIQIYCGLASHAPIMKLGLIFKVQKFQVVYDLCYFIISDLKKISIDINDIYLYLRGRYCFIAVLRFYRLHKNSTIKIEFLYSKYFDLQHF